MTGNKLFDCQEMFRHACAFCECADMAYKEEKHPTADISWYDLPAIVQSAFACEVFLKAICLFHDIELKPLCKRKQGHDLKVLYDALPQEIREQIKMEVSHGDKEKWTDWRGIQIIDEISNAFVEWRYSYEHDWNKSASMQINIGFLNQFRDCLRDICCVKFFSKTWDKYKMGENFIEVSISGCTRIID